MFLRAGSILRVHLSVFLSYAVNNNVTESESPGDCVWLLWCCVPSIDGMLLGWAFGDDKYRLGGRLGFFLCFAVAVASGRFQTYLNLAALIDVTASLPRKNCTSKEHTGAFSRRVL